MPDYRKIAPTNHAELVTTLFTDLARDGAISDTWFEDQVAFADRTDGDIDTLANRIAHIRTWTFAANRPNWLRDPHHWQERTRAIEDRLSDALHERLTARFVDRRTSVLMRRLKENAMLEAEITPTGDVLVEGQHVGSLDGFRFAPDPNADGPEAKALRIAAGKALAGEIANRADKVATAVNTDFVIASDGTLRWQGAAVAKLTEGDDALRPRLILLADDTLTGPMRDRVQARIDLWLATHIETLLKPLFDLRAAEQLSPQARGLAFRLSENLGVIERTEIADEVKALDQEARAGVRTLGVRFGAYHIYVPALLKPAPAALAAMLWALKNGGLDIAGLPELSRLASSGRTSVPVDPAITRPLYRVIGYRIAGNRAVRVDILERLADLIRPLIAWRPTPEVPDPPEGAIHGYGFTQTVSMTSLLGCSGEDFASVLRSLGYRMDRKPAPVKKAEAIAAPPTPEATDAPIEALPESPATAETPAAAPETSATAEAAPAETVAEPPESSALVDAIVTETPAESAAAQMAAPVVEAAEPAANAAAPAEPVKPAEPQMIEVWRPAGRRDRTEAPRHHRPQRPPRVAEAPKPVEAVAADGAAPAPAETGVAEARAERPPRHHRRDHDRKEGDRPRGERTARPPRDGQDRPRRDGNDRPRREGRDGPRRESRSSEPMRFSTEPPKDDKRNRPVDPNSPFAALAALKAELEAKERGG